MRKASYLCKIRDKENKIDDDYFLLKYKRSLHYLFWAAALSAVLGKSQV